MLAAQKVPWGHGVEAPSWQKFPAAQSSHCQPASARFGLARWYVPSRQVQLRFGSHSDRAGQTHRALDVDSGGE